MTGTARTGNGQIVKRSDVLDTIRGELERHKVQIAKALPKMLTADRLIALAVATVGNSPKLGECSRSSLYGAFLQSGRMGLEFGTGAGHAYIIPYGNEAVFVPGYKGLIELARRSREVGRISANVVYEGDIFDHMDGTEAFIKHKRCGEFDPAKITHAWAVIEIKGSESQQAIMWRAEIDAIRNRSRAKGSGPWATDYGEMAKKTVLRRALKYAPMSIDVQRAIALDELADANVEQRLDVEWESITGAKPDPIEVQATPATEQADA